MRSLKMRSSTRVKEETIPLRGLLLKQFSLSCKQGKRLIGRGGVRVNGRVERLSSARLKRGDRVCVEPTEEDFPKPLSTLFEDRGLIICNKPEGLVSNDRAFAPLLNQPVHLVHRLDKATSGVIVLAQNRGMQREMEQMFRKRRIVKTYVALVHGKVREQGGKIETLLHSVKSLEGETKWKSGTSGLWAQTFWKCMCTGPAFSLIQCQPHTGRMHQLRVHLSEMGHPILGDMIYGRDAPSLPPSVLRRLYLHAYRIEFKHPIHSRWVRVVAPIPDSFRSTLEEAGTFF